MPGSIALSPQIEESRILDFQRSPTVVAFLMDLCDSDLKILEKYYKFALKNSVFLRMQNTMRVRQNTKYLDYLEQEIGRLENRWVLPLVKANNIFESAIQFSDVPPKDIDVPQEGGTEVTQVKKTDIQRRKKWIDEPAIVLMKGVGVRPYKEVMKRLRNLRHRRSQYKYLEVYFLNIGRQIINLQSNLRLILAVIDAVKKTKKLADKGKVDIGSIVQEIISSNTLDDAVEKIKQFNPDEMLGDKGKGGPAGNSQAKPDSAMSKVTNARESIAASENRASGIRQTNNGDIPAKTSNPSSFGARGPNTNQGQRSSKNL